MIPKKIHYCWFSGNKMPKEFEAYIASWKKNCPDYEIIRWDETNYDVSRNTYMKDAYKEKRWGFVPDYARFDIIYQEGGIYLDTDVELLKSLDPLLDNPCFLGFEDKNHINPGLGFGAERGNPVIKALCDMYKQIDFYNKDGVWLGKETKELESFNLNETIKFDISYTYTDVNKIRLSISDEIIEAPKTKAQKTIEKWWPIAGIITLVYLLP